MIRYSYIKNRGVYMLGILFVILCAVFGYELVSFLVPDVRRLFVAIAPSKKRSNSDIKLL